MADTPRDVRLSFYATLLHRARIVYRYNLNYRRPRTHLMDRVYLSRVAACVYQSKYIRDDALSHARWMRRIPSYQVPNGYDLARYAPRPEAALRLPRALRHRSPATRVVLSAAKLTRNKGQEVAINALHRLHRQGVNVVYVVCGDGHREGELSSMAAGLKLPTVFTGLLGTRDMIAGYNAADLVVHPSLQEIFPNAVGEAMACGRAGGRGGRGRHGRAGGPRRIRRRAGAARRRRRAGGRRAGPARRPRAAARARRVRRGAASRRSFRSSRMVDGLRARARPR